MNNNFDHLGDVQLAELIVDLLKHIVEFDDQADRLSKEAIDEQHRRVHVHDWLTQPRSHDR